MRVLLIVTDGMADLPINKLKGRTPLQTAGAENLNMLASTGCSGIMDPPFPGIPPGSDVAHLNFLGYDPRLFYTGRGPLEAAGAGINVSEDGIFYRCNICRLSTEGIVTNEKVELEEGIRAVVERRINSELNERFENIHVCFKFTVGYRGVLALRGKGLTPKVRFPQPKRSIRIPKCPCGAGAMKEMPAELLREFVDLSTDLISEELRAKDPGAHYSIIPWGGGKSPKLPDFSEGHGIRGTGIAAVPLIKGICRLCGMDVPEVRGATGKPDTDLISKAKSAIEAMEKSELVLLHIEATDELSHDGDLDGKIRMIRRIDDMIGFLIDRIDLGTDRIAVISDHVTSTEMRRHTGDPVPVVVAGCRTRRDGLKEYSERSAVKGVLGRFEGKDLLRILFDKTV